MEMKPGRELNALVAEKVMSFKLRTVKTYFAGDPSLPEVHQYIGEWIKDGDQYQPSDIPFYSADIAAAWSVWERLCETRSPIIYCNTVYLSDRAFHEGLPIEAESVAHGICLAALKAIGVKTDDNVYLPMSGDTK